MRSRTLALLALASTTAFAEPTARLAPGRLAWSESGRGAMRGITIGPIENALHPGKGYGSEAYQRMLHEARRMGASWVSITPFGRVADLKPTGVDLTFEAPFPENRAAVKRAIEQAHAAGLKAMLVPHLWVENGAWRAEIDPGDDAAWQRWAAGYESFVLTWAKVAEEARADLFSAGVELRSWVTTTRAPSFVEVIHAVREVYTGPVTYAGNWDDVEDTVILGELDLIGVNAFFPLTDKEGADLQTLLGGGREVAKKMRALSELWDKPVFFSEYGYTTRRDPALRPWEWPEHLTNVVVDENAQADAYRGLLAPMIDEPWFAGAFVWRAYSDPDDVSQEAEWGFNPRGKQAELALRDAYAAWWAADGPRPLGRAFVTPAAEEVGIY
ncbi:MAG TPA: hypothetical protein VM686_24410 [Polyangiaceae bacterium]|nr:hypothetical protein [Polyangiaceae bacterium]